jgi:hypothetical protein
MDPVGAITTSPVFPAIQAPDMASAARALATQAHAAAVEFKLPEYTFRYSSNEGVISVQILDAQGRLVRMVPNEQLLQALREENINPPSLDVLA